MPTSPDLVAVEAVAAGLVARDAGGTDIQGAIPAYITQDHFHRWVPALVWCRHSSSAAGTAGKDKRGVKEVACLVVAQEAGRVARRRPAGTLTAATCSPSVAHSPCIH